MAGHSKWANIKHRKGRQDAKRGKLWSKCSRAIIVAAQRGGGDPEFNVTLRYAIDAAKAANMPRDTIEKAVKKGAGADGETERFDDVRYEGYGPAGVAIMADCLVSNPKKTAPEIRSAFDKNNGKIGTPNSVSFGFTQQGILLIERSLIEEDALMELALEAGAEDVALEEEYWQVTTAPTEFLKVKEAIDAAGIECENAEVLWTPQTTVECDVKSARQVLRLVDALEDHDDVQRVSHNAEIPPEALEDG